MILSLSITARHNQVLQGDAGGISFSFFTNAISRGNSYSICHNDFVLSGALFSFKLAMLVSQMLDIMRSCVVYKKTEMVAEISDRNFSFVL